MSSISSPHTQQLTLCTSTENVPKVDEKEKKINSCIKGAGSWKTNITALMEKKKALERALHGAIQQQINASISNEMSPNVHQQGVSSLNTPPSSVSQAPQELPHFLSATLPSQGFHRRNTTYELTTSSNLPHRDPFAGLNSPVPWTQPDQHVRLERAHSCFNEVLHSPSQRQHQCNNIFSTIRTGSVVMLQRHLASGIYSVHMRDNQEATPLHIAAYEDREDMSIVLISYGADVFALDKKRRTPKDLANPSSGVARLLLSAMEMREKNLVVAGVASATVPDILVESRRKGHSVTRNFGRLLSCPSVLEEHMTGETATPTGGVTTATSASGGKILTNVLSSYSVPSNSKGLGLAQRIAVPCEVPYALTTTGGSVDGLFSTMEGSHINSTSSADSVPKGTTDQFQQFDMNMKSISEQLRGDARSVFSEEPERERLQMRLQEVHSCNWHCI